MAYTSSDLFLTPQSIAGRKKWHYNSIDSSTLVNASSYISDAYSKGLTAGDEITQYNSSTPKAIVYLTQTVRTSSSADLSAGIMFSS